MNLGYIIALLLILNCAAEKQKVQRDVSTIHIPLKSFCIYFLNYGFMINDNVIIIININILLNMLIY